MMLNLPPRMPDEEITRLAQEASDRWVLYGEQMALYYEGEIKWSEVVWSPTNHDRPSFEVLNDEVCDETPKRAYCKRNCEPDATGFELRDPDPDEERAWAKFFERLREVQEKVDSPKELVLV